MGDGANVCRPGDVVVDARCDESAGGPARATGAVGGLWWRDTGRRGRGVEVLVYRFLLRLRHGCCWVVVTLASRLSYAILPTPFQCCRWTSVLPG